MNIVCLDLEGVLVPEIWEEFADAVGISELRRTTRDEPDYDKLMQFRLDILREQGLGIQQIQDTVDAIDPLPGAKDFLDALRAETQVIIISDTYTQFVQPLMRKLGWPTIMCHELMIGTDGMIEDYVLRCSPSKLLTVQALQQAGFDTIAAGDSFNDIDMIRAGKTGFLFRSTEAIKAANPDLQAFDEYDELLAAIRSAL